MNWKTDLFRPECNVNIDINAIPDNDYKTDSFFNGIMLSLSA